MEDHIKTSMMRRKAAIFSVHQAHSIDGMGRVTTVKHRHKEGAKKSGVHRKIGSIAESQEVDM
jgi:hypothetical protein